MLIFIIIAFLALILFIPIPLKFHIFISKDRYYIKFYNINLISNNDGIIKKLLSKKKSKDKCTKVEKSNAKNENNSFTEKKEKRKISFKKLYSKLNNNRFKPSLKFNSNTVYSLCDASRTAIFLGLFYNLNPILFYIFSILFKVKRFKNDFKPIFEDKLLFEFTVSSIITFNLAQIIYILFIIYKSTSKNRR